MTDYAIEAIGLSKSFRVRSERRTSLKERVVRGKAPEPEVFWALRDANFSVPRGGSLGLIGQNGSGKSTALKVLAGIYRPTSGEVRVNGSVSALLEVGAGFHPELTGRENIRLNATILGFSNREIDKMMDQIIEFADIGDHIDGPIKHYSSGMYVRLGFAVAVMVRPEILIVDEVIAVGDEEFQRKCYEYLYDLRRNKTSIVLVSHGLTNITDLCDEAILLERGRVLNSGPAPKVVRHYLDRVNRREAARAAAERLRVRKEQAREEQTPAVGEGVPAEAQTGQDRVAEDSLDLAQASEATATAAASPPAPPAASQTERRGSGALRLTLVQVLDADGNEGGVLISGRPATFRLHYEAREPFNALVVGIAITDHTDNVMTGANNRHLDPWDVPAGAGYIDFEARPLLLASGSYHLRAGALIGSHVLDSLDDGISFVVRPPDVEIDGVFLQPGGWRIVREDQTPAQVGAQVEEAAAPQERTAADPETVRRAVWLARLCPDAAGLPRAERAGERVLRDGKLFQRMHNGLVVAPETYDEPWLEEVSSSLGGYYQPQAERVFAAVLDRLRQATESPTLVAIGAGWGYYPLWFANALPAGKVVLADEPGALARAAENFAANSLPCSLVPLPPPTAVREVGDPKSEGPESDGPAFPNFDWSALLTEQQVSRVDLLVLDGRGAEEAALAQIVSAVRPGQLRFLFVLTHHHAVSGDPLTHQRVRELLSKAGATIASEYSVSESYGDTGLVAASFDPADAHFTVAVSRSRSVNTLRGELEWELSTARRQVDALRANLKTAKVAHDNAVDNAAWVSSQLVAAQRESDRLRKAHQEAAQAHNNALAGLSAAKSEAAAVAPALEDQLRAVRRQLALTEQALDAAERERDEALAAAALESELP